MNTLTLRWWFAYSLLTLTVHEAHELAHTVTGKLLCGTWAARDFNAWWLTGPCESIWPTAAGPLLSYLVMFTGVALAFRSAPQSRWAGIALLFSANPFARIFTSVMGGGDEMVVGRRMAGAVSRTPTVHAFVLICVAAICGTAIVMGWRAMRGLKRPALWLVAISLWPMILTGTLLFAVGNRLLRAGILDEPSITGAPFLVVLVTVVVIALSGLTVPWLSAVRNAEESRRDARYVSVTAD